MAFRRQSVMVEIYKSAIVVRYPSLIVAERVSDDYIVKRWAVGLAMSQGALG
jgi:hypothetical protein